MTGEYRLSLRGAVPLSEAAAGLSAPDVSVSLGTPAPGGSRPAETLERWLAVAGPQLLAEAPPGLTAVADADGALTAWSDEAMRLKGMPLTLWKAPVEALLRDVEKRPPTWRVRLVPRDRERPAEAVQVFLSEQSALVADGRHWLHEATYWLRHEANAELNVVLPAPGRVVAASIDGAAVAPLQPEPTRLWLPLPRNPGVRSVRLRWVYDEEPLTAPRLDRPVLEGARDGPVLWTVHVPDGFQTKQERDRGTDLRSGLARAAALDLYRAEAQAEIVRHLIAEMPAGPVEDAARSELAATERRFYQYCRQADELLALAPSTAEAGPDRQPLADWLARLHEQNRDLAKRSTDLKRIRDDAEHDAAQVRPVPDTASISTTPVNGTPLAVPGRLRVSAGGTALPERGTPFAGHGSPDAEPPLLRLTPDAEDEARAALLGAGWWLALLIGVSLLALMPAVLRWTRPFWPEQLLLLGLLGWCLAGPRPGGRGAIARLGRHPPGGRPAASA